jgi:hypothetical protein
MAVEINKESARHVLSALAGAGWRSAQSGLEILDSLEEFSYRASPMSTRDAAGLYASRAVSVREAGRASVDVERFVNALDESTVADVVIFSLADDYWSCICVTSVDLHAAIAAVALPVVRETGLLWSE